MGAILFLNYRGHYKLYGEFEKELSLEHLQRKCRTTAGNVYSRCFRTPYREYLRKADIDTIIHMHSDAAKVIMYDKKVIKLVNKEESILNSSYNLCDSALMSLKALRNNKRKRSLEQKIINFPLEWLRNWTAETFKERLKSKIVTLGEKIINSKDEKIKVEK